MTANSGVPGIPLVPPFGEKRSCAAIVGGFRVCHAIGLLFLLSLFAVSLRLSVQGAEMIVQRIAAVSVLALLAAAPGASAQEIRGFASAGVTSDVNDQRFPAFGGGVLVDLGQPWVSAGAQGETFVSWPYFAGRAAVFGQGNLAPKKAVRPFVLAGVGFGEDAGPMFGGGVELRAPNQRLGFRFAVEDYVVRLNGFEGSRTGHQVALRAAILF